MKEPFSYVSKLEAEMAAGALRAEGIKVTIVGFKDYVSISMGSDIGKFKLELADSDKPRAEEILKQLSATSSEQVDKPARHYFKRAVICIPASFVILPIVFNIFGLVQLRKYAKLEPDSPRKYFLVTLVAALHLAVILGIAYYTLKYAL